MGKTSYWVVGALYCLWGFPALIALVLGQLQRGGNPYFAISFMGVPLGILFILYSRWPQRWRFLSDTAVRLGIVTQFQLVFCIAAWWVVNFTERKGFGTAYHFFGMIGSFLSILIFVFLIANLFRQSAPAESEASE